MATAHKNQHASPKSDYAVLGASQVHMTPLYWLMSCGLCGEWDWCHISGIRCTGVYNLTGLISSIKKRDNVMLDM